VHYGRAMRLVAAAEAHVDEILHLWRAASVEPTITDDAASVRQVIGNDPRNVALALDEGVVVGSVIAGWDGWRGTIYRLAVAPSHRRQGIATSLVAEAERSLIARGARRASLVVVSNEAAVISFWTAIGYTPQDDRTRFVRNLPD
jgi:ribosomal protein S18 acetylase RimI-like enzyme